MSPGNPVVPPSYLSPSEGSQKIINGCVTHLTKGNPAGKPDPLIFYLHPIYSIIIIIIIVLFCSISRCLLQISPRKRYDAMGSSEYNFYRGGGGFK